MKKAINTFLSGPPTGSGGSAGGQYALPPHHQRGVVHHLDFYWSSAASGIPAFDPYPCSGLLTMIVSPAIFFEMCFVLISQNRQAAGDRVRSGH